MHQFNALLCPDRKARVAPKGKSRTLRIRPQSQKGVCRIAWVRGDHALHGASSRARDDGSGRASNGANRVPLLTSMR